MLITCPNCAASYEVKADAVAAGGRPVRCSRCRTVWTVESEHAGTALVRLPAGGEVADAPMTSAGFAAIEVPPSGDPAIETLPPVLVHDAPALVPAIESPTIDHDPGTLPPESGASEDIERQAARRARRVRARPAKQKRRLGLPLLIIGLIAMLAALAVWRNHIVRLAPQTASLFTALHLPVNVRGLAIENVKTMREVHEGVMVLIVEGQVANVVGHNVDVPRLRFAMRNAQGQEVYAWTNQTGRTMLRPGEMAAFRTRLASPPADGRDVIVRFFTRRDIIGGLN